jgi:hypothetical protein
MPASGICTEDNLGPCPSRAPRLSRTAKVHAIDSPHGTSSHVQVQRLPEVAWRSATPPSWSPEASTPAPAQTCVRFRRRTDRGKRMRVNGYHPRRGGQSKRVTPRGQKEHAWPMAPGVGLEPTTYELAVPRQLTDRFTAGCRTPAAVKSGCRVRITVSFRGSFVGLTAEQERTPNRGRLVPPGHGPLPRADDGIRTRDPHLGKVVLYR